MVGYQGESLPLNEAYMQLFLIVMTGICPARGKNCPQSDEVRQTTIFNLLAPAWASYWRNTALIAAKMIMLAWMI